MERDVVSRLRTRISPLPLEDNKRGAVVGDHEIVPDEVGLVALPGGLRSGFDFSSTEVCIAMVDESSVSGWVMSGRDAYAVIPWTCYSIAQVL